MSDEDKVGHLLKGIAEEVYNFLTTSKHLKTSSDVARLGLRRPGEFRRSSDAWTSSRDPALPARTLPRLRAVRSRGSMYISKARTTANRFYQHSLVECFPDPRSPPSCSREKIFIERSALRDDASISGTNFGCPQRNVSRRQSSPTRRVPACCQQHISVHPAFSTSHVPAPLLEELWSPRAPLVSPRKEIDGRQGKPTTCCKSALYRNSAFRGQLLSRKGQHVEILCRLPRSQWRRKRRHAPIVMHR